MILLNKTFYLCICICIYYANASTPIEKLMEQLIKLISDDQVNKNFIKN